MLEKLLHERPPKNFSALSLATIDFQTGKINCEEWWKGEKQEIPRLIYDLASLTKAITLFPSYLFLQNKMPQDLMLLLEHRASLPATAYLSSKTWREDIMRFPIVVGPTVYSDLGALRYMLELEKRELFDFQQYYEDQLRPKNIFFWRDLTSLQKLNCPPTGFRHFKTIQGEVNDHNAYNLKTFCVHAGLFAGVVPLAQWFLDLEKQFSWMKLIVSFLKNKKHPHRFLFGLDRAEGENSLSGCNANLRPFVVGHLGHTGTSLWFDCEERKGYVLLTNGTEQYAYNRDEINFWRRKVGMSVWS